MNPMLRGFFSVFFVVLMLGVGCNNNPTPLVCSSITNQEACDSQPPPNGSEWASACAWSAAGTCADASDMNACASYGEQGDCTGTCSWANGACTGADNDAADVTALPCSFYLSQRTCEGSCNWDGQCVSAS